MAKTRSEYIILVGKPIRRE